MELLDANEWSLLERSAAWVLKRLDVVWAVLYRYQSRYTTLFIIPILCMFTRLAP